MLIKMLKKRLSPYVEQAIVKAFRKEHLRPINEMEPQDMFVVGYPKSGNTWMQNLIASLLYGIDSKLLPDSLTKELVPDVHYKKYYKRFLDSMVFKSHGMPKPHLQKVIFITRDPRDAMSSYYAMQKNFVKGLSMEKMIVEGEHIFPCKWYEHTAAWLDNPYKADIHRLRYEDLVTNTLEELKKICHFMGLERSDEQIMQAIEGNSFENMKKKESSYGVEGFPTRSSEDEEKNASFYRKGKIGSYKEDLPQKYIEYINQEAKEQMVILGYTDI